MKRIQVQKQNYQKILDRILDEISAFQNFKKPSLLLHACCAPCSSYVIEYLSNYFDITILYYNPNIYPKEEYNRRLSELEYLLKIFPASENNNVKISVHDYIPQEFYEAVNIKNEPELADEPEKGLRCSRCYKLRMLYSYRYAVANNFDWFTTTLSISPFKDVEKINLIGKEIEMPGKTKFLSSDFKKCGGFQRSLELSREFGLYRQNYCGCIFSKKNTEKALQEKN